MSTPSRHILFEASDHRVVSRKLTDLEALYKRTYKRGLPIEVYLHSGGTNEKPIYGLTAYYTEPQRADLRWLLENISV